MPLMGNFPIEIFAIIALIVLIFYFKKIQNQKISLDSQEFFKTKHVDWMEGIEFEKFLERLFLALDFKVKRTPASRDMGADLILESKSKVIAVQAKRQESSVGNKAVQQIIAGMDYYHANEGWVISNSEFTTSAFKQASPKGIKLINGDGLKKLQRDAYRNLTKQEPPKKGLEKLWTNQGIGILSAIVVMLVIVSSATNSS